MTRDKGLAALAVVGLLLGAGSLGFIVYEKFLAPAPDEQQLQEIWAKYDGSSYYCLPNPASYLDITNTFITFTLERDASMHFIYTGDAYIDDSSGQSYMYIDWRVNGSIIPWGNAHISGNGSAGRWHIPTCIQLTLEMTAGTHNVTVALRGDSTTNCVRESYLVLTAYYH
ncbi:MAG: hypothetical protein JW839_20285 [Candidatus Lokiarchaeota archaeon]|nr:hypothetical protein [Candidatus Lokiarchaeota archaeon]